MGLGIVQVPYRDACQAWEVVWKLYGSVLETACQMSAACESQKARFCGRVSCFAPRGRSEVVRSCVNLGSLDLEIVGSGDLA